MKQNSGISFDSANSSLSESDRELTGDINARAAEAGYTSFIKAAGKEPDNYKIEYKKAKSTSALFVLRIAGNKWSLRCKLHHIGEYAGMLEELSEPIRRGLLSSKKCRSDAGKCKGPVRFVAGGEKYSLCRHSMQFQGLAASDIPAVWRLIEAESLYATQEKGGD